MSCNVSQHWQQIRFTWGTSRFKLDLEKAEKTRDQIANICWIIKKAREFQKNVYFFFIDYAKAFDCVQFGCSVMTYSLWPHGRQHTRRPCPSPTPGAYSNSCPTCQWCHSMISSSVVPFSSCLQSFLVSESFPMSWLFASGGQSTGVSTSSTVIPMNIQNLFPSEWTGWISLQSKGLSRVFSSINSSVPSFLYSSTLTSRLEKP